MVDDNPGDARLTIEALKEIHLAHRFHWVPDGEEALTYLRHAASHAQPPRPDLILLDLNLPRTDGREVLAEIKSDPDLKEIPVIILTTSLAEEDINRAYHLSANCYIRKPVTMEQFIRVISSIRHFWCEIVTLPSEPVFGRHD
jgi:chemotaxis family two-component system response regulator Rcp1